VPIVSNGYLRLAFRNDPLFRRTVLTTSEQHYPLKVVRGFELRDGSTLVHLHNLSGGVLGGDKLEITVDVGRMARAQLTTTGATRLYRSRNGSADAMQSNKVTIASGGLLEYLPDQLIPFAGSRYRQDTVILLEDTAGLFWWETVAPGREARGEVFAYDSLKLNLEIRVGARPIALERIKLEPAIRPLTSPARMSHFLYFSSFYICRVGLETSRWRTLEEILRRQIEQFSTLDGTLWGVSTLPAHGLIVRVLSRRGRDILPGLTILWRIAKLELYGEEAIPPRKVN